MALEKYQEYLAAQVLNEGRPISYRLLSRAIKVHHHVAKQMLYEFHRTQTARKPGSIHATYLITGVRKPEEPGVLNGTHDQDGDDVAMKDEPMMSSSMPDAEDQAEGSHEELPIPVTSMTLVQEEHLKDVKEQHDMIHSVYVYSLEPSRLQNMQLLTDCTRRLGVETAAEDPLESWKQYGTIGNPSAKRRTAGRAAPAPQPRAATTAGMKPATNKATAAATKSADNERPVSAAAKSARPAGGPKRESSDLFKSFAKTPAVPAKVSKMEDETMIDADDEDDAALSGLTESNNAEAKAKAQAAQQAKREREKTLQKMMDEEDEQEEAKADESSESDDQPAIDKADDADDGDVEMQEAGNGPTGEAETGTEVEQATTINGRRRGRRRVMKKKTTKDADGYLVTKQEAGWESFSEDEKPAAKKPVGASAATAAATAAAGGKTGVGAAKAGGGKKGQGNIMNFFSKK